jgi:hypothetical protein
MSSSPDRLAAALPDRYRINVRSRFYRAPGGAYLPIQSRTCSYQ